MRTIEDYFVKIFDWYAEDFRETYTFINKYSSIIVSKNAIIVYKDYDWNLNDK